MGWVVRKWSRRLASLLFLGLGGCYDAPRTNPFDPALTPAVELLAVSVDSTSGSALLKWSPYAGQQPFAEYRVLRQVKRLVDVDTVAVITNVRQTSFRDTTPEPEVEYAYWVEVVNQGGFDVESGKREGVVYALPSIELLQPEFSSDTATAELVWTQYRGPGFTVYEVRRRAPRLAEEIVRTLDEVSDTTYTDSLLDGNTEYTYHIVVRTGWGKEASVSSTEKSGRFYPLDHVLDLPSFPVGTPQAIGLAVDEQDNLYIAMTLIVLPTDWGQSEMNQGVQVRFPGRDFETFFSEVHPHHLSAIHIVAGQGKVYVSVGLQDSTILVGALDTEGQVVWADPVDTGGTLPVGLHLEANGSILMIDDQAVVYDFSPEGQMAEPDSRLQRALGLYQVLPLGRVAVGTGVGPSGSDQFFILAPALRSFHVFTRTRSPRGAFSQFESFTPFDVEGTGIENNQTLSPVVLAFDPQRVRLLVLEAQGRLKIFDARSEDTLPDVGGRYITQWGRFGTGEGEFLIPVPVGVAVVVDSTGMIYVMDGMRVQVFAP